MATNLASGYGRGASIGPMLVFGFASSVALWTTWFLTHLPWTGVSDLVRMILLIGIWTVFMFAAGLACGAHLGWKVGLGAGLTTAILGLLLLGSKLAPSSGTPDPNRPSVAIVILGFLAVGGVLGTIAGGVGGLIRGKDDHWRDWLCMFAFTTVAAAFPLLFVGGLVTSTNSGMAVPDWPNTYGVNMFLYPLGTAGVPIFLEHSHRLFGTLLGATSLVLMVWVLVAEPRRWVKIWAISVFAAVCLQGYVGGKRVLENSPVMGVAHGVFAQLIFAGLVALAVILWATSERAALSKPFANPRRVRVFATAALHTVLLQLVFGATYRHLRELHALWAHIGFSFVVLITGIVGGFWASAVPKDAGPLVSVLRRCGWGIVAVVLLQFLLGWAALGMGGREREAPSIAAALIRTVHQANGAILLGLTTAAAVLAKLLFRQVGQKPIS